MNTREHRKVITPQWAAERGRTHSPVLASTGNPTRTNHVQRVHERMHLRRKKEDITGLMEKGM